MKIATKEKIGVKPIRILWEFAEVEMSIEIQVIPCGEWEHAVYGPMRITAADITEFVRNFNAGIRNDIPITEGHEVMEQKPAVGWFRELYDRGEDGLYAKVEWNEKGKELLQSKSYKYFSPEFYQVYEDPQTHKTYYNVLVGGALTNTPYFKELEPVAVFTEPKLISQFNEPKSMNLQDILKKQASELSTEEKTFLKDHKAELSDADKTTFSEVLDDTPADDTPPADNPPADNPPQDTPPTTPVQASEKGMVKISASELQALTEKANAGHRALEILTDKEIGETVSKLTFSESNKDGKFLPKSKDKVTAFVKSLTEKQRKEFSDMISELPRAQMFSEVGDGGESDTSAAKKVDDAAKKLMSENTGMQYADALKKVFSENPQLAKAYDEENPAA